MIKKKFKPFHSRRMENIALSAIKAMERKARKMTDVISLAQGIPAFKTPHSIHHRAIEAMEDGTASFYTVPEGNQSLRRKISQDVFRRSQALYHPDEEVLVTAGAMAAIQAAMLTIVDPGDEVVVITPAYASYFGQIHTAGGVPVPVALDRDRNFRLDLEAVKQAITPRTRAILFANPSNPTGTNFTATELQGLCQVAVDHNLYLIADEVYRDFVWEGEHLSASSFEEVRDQLILVFGFSKAYAMTGYRVGYLCGPAELVQHILKIHDNMVTCAPHPAQIAAEAALDSPMIELERRNQVIRRNRDRIMERLSEIPGLEFHCPQGAYYMFVQVDGGTIDSVDFCYYLLEQVKVAAVPGSAFGSGGNGYIRFSYAVEPSRLERAFDRLQEHLGRRGGRVLRRRTA